MTGSIIPRKWAANPPIGDDLPPQKRISTPAGMRLSVIMNQPGSADGPTPSRPSPISTQRPPQLAFVSEQGGGVMVTQEVDVESTHLPTPVLARNDRSASPSPYTQSVFSEKSVLEPVGSPKRRPSFQLPSARRRLFLVLGLVFAVIVLLAVGLGVGLSKKHASKSKSPNASSSASSSSPTYSPQTTTVALPSDFPKGTFSLYTALDTVTTDCTSNTAAWTCTPNVIFNSDPAKALATFNIAITGSDSAYSIAPVDTTGGFAGVQFSQTPLRIMDKGKPSESYRFQASYNKVVQLDIKGAPATCYYNSTTFQGWLYTKMVKDYPAQGQALPSGNHQQWPFAVKIEEVISGGGGIPDCYKADGTKITDGFVAQDPTNLCDCLYKNWRTPTP